MNQHQHAPLNTHSDKALLALLEGFSDAWNRHDLAALMNCMHDDCVFLTAAGNEPHGTRHAGPAAVSKAFASAWETFPDARWRDARHWVSGDRGVSEWTFTGTAADGTRSESCGIDLFIFRDGKILEKNVFRKDRPRLPAR